MPPSQGMLSSKATQHNILIPVLICLALAILTVITFWTLKDCGFINFDDGIFVFENTYVQSGLNWNSIGQAFSSELVKKSGWCPLTWLSLMLDYQIFGLNPHGYHLINLLFHVISTILLFLIFHRMTKKLWPSAFVACLFAIHPLHVESVAWIAERRDVLSTFFLMLTLGAYGYYVEHPGFRRYCFVFLFFVLGLMAKPMLVTLPFVLLLLDYWPLQRFQEVKQDHKVQAEVFKSVTSDKQKNKSKKKNAIEVSASLELKKPAEPEYKWSLIYPLLWEKVPLFVLVILSSIVTYIAARSVGFILSEAIPLDVRIGNAFVSYIAYIGKMIWPSNLAVFYPYPGLLVPWQVLVSVLLLFAITLVVIWRAKRFPYLATGWLWYIGTLVPVIGIVQLGNQAMADRYTYIPLIGLFITVAWGVPDLLKKWNYRKEILLASSALSILCLSIITWTQVGYWQNDITLFDHTVKVTDYNWLIYNNRGAANAVLGNYMQTIEDCGRSIEIKPGFANAYNNRGFAYNQLGNYKQAIEDYDRAIEIKPAYAEAYYNRGIAYTYLGNYRQAIEDYSRAIEIKPGYTEAYYNRGIAYTYLGDYRQAIEDCSRAIEIKPNYTMAYYNRAIVYLNQGDNISGCRDVRKVCELGNCKLLEAANTRGSCL
jgi:protein O-mannosyl-transferase